MSETIVRALYAIGVFLVAWLVFWLIGELLQAIPTEPTVWLGAVVHKVEVVLAALVAVLYFVRGSRL